MINGCEDGSTDFTVTTAKDSDSDGIPDYLDLDSDADGCADAVEAGTNTYTVNTTSYQVDNATPDGLTNAPYNAPTNDNRTNPAIKSAACGALPLTFENVNAFLRDGMLEINWTTATERENDHFEIEVSKDGKTWSKAGGNIKTKATDLSVTAGYSYEQTISLTGTTVMGLSLFLLSISMMFRKNKWLGLAVVLMSASTMLYSCTKANSDLSAGPQKIYVRVKQVDKNGAVSYSKVVTAVTK